jgi:hypothetical protein
MNATTAANARAKNVFQVVLADSNARVLEHIGSPALNSSAYSITAKWHAW